MEKFYSKEHKRVCYSSTLTEVVFSPGLNANLIIIQSVSSEVLRTRKKIILENFLSSKCTTNCPPCNYFKWTLTAISRPIGFHSNPSAHHGTAECATLSDVSRYGSAQGIDCRGKFWWAKVLFVTSRRYYQHTHTHTRGRITAVNRKNGHMNYTSDFLFTSTSER